MQNNTAMIDTIDPKFYEKPCVKQNIFYLKNKAKTQRTIQFAANM